MDSTNSTFSPLGQQKNLPCSHHAWPSFVFLPHYSKKTSQVRALQSAHLSLPILLFPGKASPTARCSQKRNPLFSFWELPLTKKHELPTMDFTTAYNMHTKNDFKRHLEPLIFTHRMTICAQRIFCMSLLFSRKWDQVSNVTNRIELVQHKSSLPASEATFTDVSLPCLFLIGHSSSGWLFSLYTCN